ncbi:hypothetical protein O1L60_00985 [Streptomyces diastatochromogenes]|nr:hypothetical protein [Streptomyces diastatochromogenes]
MNDDAYSATHLGSHWFEGPAPPPCPTAWRARCCASARSDRGRRAPRREHPTAAQIWHGTLPGAPPPRRPRSRWPLRYAPAAVLLLAVLALLAWRAYGPRLSVRDVAVTAPRRRSAATARRTWSASSTPTAAPAPSPTTGNAATAPAPPPSTRPSPPA